ncbi:MAG: hypothetical protein HC837_12680 [Chloroflexaceae bacterium]|nr:hypothetical protein [Chloroflexaceae bacterium]
MATRIQKSVCLCVLLLVFMLASTLTVPPSTHAQTDALTQFQTFWEQHGGLEVFGYPLTSVITETDPSGQQRFVQWFERARMEIAAAQPSAVMLSTIGTELRGFVDDPVPAETGCLFLSRPSSICANHS